MKNLIDIFQATAWFALCVFAAIFLLAVALFYNGFVMVKKGFLIKKFEFPKLQLAR